MSGDGRISTERTVWCALCDEWHQEAVRTKAEMAEAARALGWHKIKTHGWVCPACYDKHRFWA